MGEKLSSNKLVVATFLCGMFYAVLFALHAAEGILDSMLASSLEFEFGWLYNWVFRLLLVPGFESPMYWAMPFFGFFAVFMLVDWVNGYFSTKLALSPVFPLAFFLLALSAYYVSLYWYVANFASLQGIEMSLDLVDFWGRLRISSYMLFLWSGVFGWIARYVVEKIKI